MPQALTIQKLQSEATAFARGESAYPEPTLYGVTDGKAVGNYLEHKFQAHLNRGISRPPSASAACLKTTRTATTSSPSSRSACCQYGTWKPRRWPRKSCAG